jgi:hypothetical protein
MGSLILDGAIRIILAIIESQKIERMGICQTYYEAGDSNAHKIIRKKGIHIPKNAPFGYKTFKLEEHFIVVATALPQSGMEGRIIYESKTGQWIGTGEIKKEWLPLKGGTTI